ncbi:MAG: hypothetical protein HYR88_05165 [Verrucomicrobia bacterium]|nr:hypothetical protein [Verrucomicrobiota bacterium]MBI3869092.1 hypothetical protein [Verrucomicrobiota bacterium]
MNRSLPVRLLVSAALVLNPTAAFTQSAAGPHPLVSYELELAQYATAPSEDAVARLQKRIDAGEVTLAFEPTHGFLNALLKELGLSPSSQLLVFSKTSLQRYHITSKSPRALFFNERVYMAWIPGAPMLEFLAEDPQLGAVLYTLEQTNVAQPRFVRDNRCLECHVGPRTLGIPGRLVRSMRTTKDGDVDLLSGAAIVSHSTPLKDRWGGWYVTGAYGALEHQGNHFSLLTPTPQPASTTPSTPSNPSAGDLRDFLDISRYPTPTSDVTALLVLEHQTHLANLLTRLGYEARASLRQWGHINSLTNVLHQTLNDLLFVGEIPLAGAIRGESKFVEGFQGQGPRDSQGRSLREFDLQTRLFKYPCSYMIHSDAFAGLPRAVKLRLYRRLYAVLTGEDSSGDFQSIPAEKRRAVLEILADTQKDLPAYWKL